ncbi:MAG: manganese efflux pump MntP family protein [Clostridia bacterium]|nr:manganese efflux pump MntP family protein [Clostridia bacterium]
MDVKFFLNSCLLGLALAADAFAVSVANGMDNPNMKKGRMFLTSGVFGLFQFAMPIIGWLVISYLQKVSKALETAIPYIALVLLAIIGTKMIVEAILDKGKLDNSITGFVSLLIQGLATSIDALSVGFVNSHFTILETMISSLIIGVITFALCLIGVFVGKKFGEKYNKLATILGGIILIGIGLEIYFTNLLGI